MPCKRAQETRRGFHRGGEPPRPPSFRHEHHAPGAFVRAARVRAAWLLVVALVACESYDESSESAGEPTERDIPAAQPEDEEFPPRLQLGQPPASIPVPIPPSYHLEILEDGEYQIDVRGAPRNPVAFLYRGEELVAQNDDGGEDQDARIVEFLSPGTYSLRVVEHEARPFTAQVSAQHLEPLPLVGTVTLGAPHVVAFPDPPRHELPRTDRDAAKAVALDIATGGSYSCTASADNGRSAKMALIRGGRVLEVGHSTASRDATFRRTLRPGRYVIRVWDWIHRGNTRITVECQED